MKLVYSPVRCRIVEATDKEMRVARNVLRARMPGYWFAPSFKEGRWDGWVSFLSRRTFLSGLLPLLREALDKKDMGLDIEYKHTQTLPHAVPTDDLLEGFELRDNQVRCIDTALEQQRGIIKGPPAAGKTLMMAGIIECLSQGMRQDPETLIVVPSTSLLYQTHEEVQEYLGRPVGRLGDGKKDIQTITVAIINSVKIRMSNDPSFRKWVEGLDVLLIDEAHKAESGPKYLAVGEICRAGYRIAFSATPLTKGNQVRNYTLLGITGPVIEKIEWKEQFKKGFSAVPHIHFWEFGYDKPQFRGSTKDSNVYRKVYISHPEKNNLIHEKTKLFVAHDVPTAILIERTEHGELIRDQLQSMGIDAHFVYGEVSGKKRDQERKDFIARRYPVLVCSRVFGEGINIPNAQGIILANESFKPEKTEQEIGRGNRPDQGRKEKFWVIDFINWTHKHAYDRSLSRLKKYKSIPGFVVHELNTLPEVSDG